MALRELEVKAHKISWKNPTKYTVFHNKYKPIEFASSCNFHTGVFKFKLYVVYKRKTKKIQCQERLKIKVRKDTLHRY